MNRVRLPKIPRLWQIAIAATVGLTAIISLALLITRNSSMNYGCLYLSGLTNHVMLDINRGRYFFEPMFEPKESTSVLSGYSFTNRNKKIALLNDRGVLEVLNLQRPLSFETLLSHFQLSPYANSDVRWLPGGQYIFYQWIEGTGSGSRIYFNIAAADGKLVRQIELNKSALPHTAIIEWTADGKYIIMRGLERSGELAFLSVPDLKVIDESENAPRIGAVVKSDEGHSIAYTLYDTSGQVQLVIKRLGETIRRTFNLSADSEYVLSLSPDGRLVAVGSHTSLTKAAHLDLYSLDGAVYPNIDEIKGRATYLVYTTFRWSLDGKSLFYGRQKPNDAKFYEVIQYRIDTGESKVVLTTPRNTSIEPTISASPDSQAIAIYVDSRELYLASQNSKAVAHFPAITLSQSELVWSPDSTVFAYQTYDPTTNTQSGKIDVHVVSNKGIELGRFADNLSSNFTSWMPCGVPS